MYRRDVELAYIYEETIMDELKKVKCPDVHIKTITRNSEGYTVIMETAFEEAVVYVRKIFRNMAPEDEIPEPLDLIKENAKRLQEHYDDVSDWLMDIILKAEEEDDVLGGRIL